MGGWLSFLIFFLSYYKARRGILFFPSDLVFFGGGGGGRAGGKKERLLGLGLIFDFLFFSCTVPAWFFSFFFSLIFFSPGGSDDDGCGGGGCIIVYDIVVLMIPHTIISFFFLSFPLRVGFCFALRFASTQPRASFFRQFLSATHLPYRIHSLDWLILITAIRALKMHTYRWI